MKINCILFFLVFYSSLIAKQEKPAPKEPPMDIFTASFTGNLVVIKQHVAAGANLNAKESKGGNAPLMLATLTGQVKAVKLLLEKGAEVNAKNAKNGDTALHVAAFFGYPEVTKVLLEKGAKPNVANKAGKTPLDPVDGEWTPQLEELYKFVGAVLQIELNLERIKQARPKIAYLLRKKGAKTSKELK